MTCEDCVHYKVCYEVIHLSIQLPFDDTMPADKFCSKFINKSDCVKVTRCKDCKFYEEVEYYHPTYNNAIKTVCRLYKRTIQDDDFCSYGERREEN